MSTTVSSVPLSTRSGLVKIPERGREGGGARERVRERARAREIVNYLKETWQSVPFQKSTLFTQSPLSIRIHFLCHLQSLCGCYVNVAWNNHQADSFLFCDETLDQSLYLKVSIQI